ncbi:unnamed protein product [Effrenium voratum]|uniref:EGF-like domain-containing protein n=1 Tax=Effrenium voratum TaxID=2562239 RepID=A0AA36NB57_9DINO|nr:unnamed protein product [Effrenium voratum]
MSVRPIGVPYIVAALYMTHATHAALAAPGNITIDPQDSQALHSVLVSLGLSPEMATRVVGDCGILRWCDHLGRVRRLAMPRMHLAGRLDPQLLRLTELRELSLSQNRLQGHIPSLAGLRELHHVDLSKNLLSGSIPSLPPNLAFLELADNYLTGTVSWELGRLQNLQLLDLSNNQLFGAIPNLRNCSALATIFLRNNFFMGRIPGWLRFLPRVRKLDLSKNQFYGQIPSGFRQRSTLHQLSFHSNKLWGHLPDMSGFEELQILDVGWNKLQGEFPGWLCNMKKLKILSLTSNRLFGRLPSLANMTSLEVLSSAMTRFSGPLPALAGKLQFVKLGGNRFEGPLPELGSELFSLDLSSNRLTGPLPALPKSLSTLDLSSNNLSGEIPVSLAGLRQLTALYLANNQLTGEVPPIFAHLGRLSHLSLAGNRLHGHMPDLSDMYGLLTLDLSSNFFTGQIGGKLQRARRLSRLSLRSNRFHGEVLPEQFPRLTELDLGQNYFDTIPLQFYQANDLSELYLDHNVISGTLLPVICNSRKLRILHLGHNRLEGEIPGCIFQLPFLTQLFLSRNKFEGSIPEIGAEYLSVLSLHRNRLSGALPAFSHLSFLAVLTLHDNSFSGSIGNMELTSCCMDNPHFRDSGLSCVEIMHALHLSIRLKHCEELSRLELNASRVLRNCPLSCGLCTDMADPPRATFHHNRLSCEVPPLISGRAVLATAVMGNMLGNGHSLAAPWIMEDEYQNFLYFSPKVFKDNCFVLSAAFLLALAGLLFRKRLAPRISEALAADGRNDKVISSNLVLLRFSGFLSICCCLLLPALFWGATYYDCPQPLSWFTVAGLEQPWAELVVVLTWCALAAISAMTVASMPGEGASLHACGLSARKALAWLVWMLVVAVMSLPSILFAVAQVLPAANTSGLSDQVLSLCHSIAPFGIVLLDASLASKLSEAYANFAKLRAENLLMALRLCTFWLLSVLTTVWLHENCMGGWKRYWRVCDARNDAHDLFNWNVWDEVVLDTDADICSESQLWWQEGRCSRAVVEAVVPLVLKKLLIRATLQPGLMLLVWHLSQPEQKWNTERHLRLLGLKTSSSLSAVQQQALLTTFMETAIFWAPLAPLCGLCTFCASVANLLLFHQGTRPEGGVQLGPSGASMSRGYLQFSLAASCGFQVWHAFGTGMWGRQLLLLNCLVVLMQRFLPRNWAAKHFWRADMQTVELQEMPRS